MIDGVLLGYTTGRVEKKQTGLNLQLPVVNRNCEPLLYLVVRKIRKTIIVLTIIIAVKDFHKSGHIVELG